MTRARFSIVAADAPGPEGFRPGRLWSRLEMLKHDAAAFYHATVALGMNRIKVGDEMQRNPAIRTKPVKLRDQHTIKDALAAISEGVRTLNLPFVQVAAERLLATLENPDPNHTWEWLEEELRQLEIRLTDCLGGTYLLALDGSEAALFDPKEPLMPADFAQRFGAANREIGEASKCLALGRDTACVFHSLRCLESGMQALMRSLGIVEPMIGADRNWGAYLRKIRGELERRWPTIAAKACAEYEFYDHAYAALAAMQNPWRNATMHLDQTYQRDDARHILEAVKAFMSRTNARMDENGEPKA